jgi:hypothetical protein
MRHGRQFIHRSANSRIRSCGRLFDVSVYPVVGKELSEGPLPLVYGRQCSGELFCGMADVCNYSLDVLQDHGETNVICFLEIRPFGILIPGPLNIPHRLKCDPCTPNDLLRIHEL